MQHVTQAATMGGRGGNNVMRRATAPTADSARCAVHAHRCSSSQQVHRARPAGVCVNEDTHMMHKLQKK